VSASVAVAVKDSSVSSSVDWFPIGSSIGDRLTSLTVTVISSKSDSVPSVTVTLNVCNPFCASVGVHVNSPDVELIAAPDGSPLSAKDSD